MKSIISIAAFLFLVPSTLFALEVDCEVSPSEADITYGTDRNGLAMVRVEHGDLSAEVSFEEVSEYERYYYATGFLYLNGEDEEFSYTNSSFDDYLVFKITNPLDSYEKIELTCRNLD